MYDVRLPSAASTFSGGLEDMLLEREKRKRQDLLDQHSIRLQDAELKLKQDALNERKQDRERDDADRKEAQKDKADAMRQTKWTKQRAEYVAGDVPTPDMAQLAIDSGNAGQLVNPPQDFTDEAGTVTHGLPALSGVMAQPPDAQTLVSNKIPLRLGATPAERQRKEQDDYIASLPFDSPARQAYQAERVGLKTPANTFVPPKPPPAGVHQARVNPRTGVNELMVNGQWVKAPDVLPEGTHFESVPAPKEPKDTSAQDLARMDRSYQLANGSLETIRKPLADQVERFGRLTEAVNQGTPQADALIAPELLTVMAGGAGSGLRMNEAEIARIIGGRSNFEGLKAALNKWQLDPSKALSVTPAQREQIRALMKTVQARSDAKLGLINEASQRLIDAPDVDTHRRIVSETRKKIDEIGSKGVESTRPETKVFTSGPYRGKTGVKLPGGGWEIQQ